MRYSNRTTLADQVWFSITLGVKFPRVWEKYKKQQQSSQKLANYSGQPIFQLEIVTWPKIFENQTKIKFDFERQNWWSFRQLKFQNDKQISFVFKLWVANGN